MFLSSLSYKILSLAAFIFCLAVFVPGVDAVDNPHNSAQAIRCSTCHDKEKSALTAAWWTDQEKNVCGQCHNSAAKTGMDVTTHYKDGVLLVQCTACHDPHNQMQSRKWGAESYLNTGVVTSVTETSMTVSAANWQTDLWQGLLLIPNVNYPGYSYRISSNTSDTVFITSTGIAPDNVLNFNYAKPGGTYAIVYGKLIRDVVNGSEVKFFRQTGTNSFADDDSTIDGICQVCHTNTQYFRSDGSVVAGNHVAPAGVKCSECHNHQGGFKATCNSCHGYPPLAAASLVTTNGSAPGTTYSSTAGAHAKHASSEGLRYGCAVCHGDNFSTSNHNAGFSVTIGFSDIARIGANTSSVYNGQSAVSYNVSNNDTTVTKNGGSLTCSTTYCHGGSMPENGGTATNPVWDAAPGAYSCSSMPNGACHGATAANAPGKGSHGKHNRPSPEGYNYECSLCHPDPSSDSSLHVNGLSEVTFSSDPRTTGGTYTGTPGALDAYGACSNFYCHGDGTAVTTGSASTKTSPEWGSGSISCSTCHGFPPAYKSGSPKANSHLSHNFTCDTCHYSTTATGSAITGNLSHVNKSYDLISKPGTTFSYAFDPTGGSCSTVSCHSNTGTAWGQSACLDCHSIALGARAAVTPQFSGNSHHIQGSPLTNDKCYQCHWEANADGSINRAWHGGPAAPGSPVSLVIYGPGTRPASYSSNVTGIEYSAGSRTEIAKITKHCLSCHSDQNNSTQPFGDGKTPRQYAWDGSSVDARYSQAGTTTWGKYTGVAKAAKKNIIKAFSAHGNAALNQAGWSAINGVDGVITDTTGTSAAAAVQCFDCHNSHGSGISGITTNYTSATNNGGILKDTSAGKGGYTVDYRPVAGGSSENKNAYNPGAALCFDCHINESGSTTPWGYSTFGATSPILGYWDSEYFGPGSFGPQRRYNYKFTGHQGGHFGESSGTGLSSPAARSINGLCTPCHDPHGVSPSISSCSKSGFYTKVTCESNGGIWSSSPQYAVPLLKGTFLTSPYKEDVAPSGVSAGTALKEGLPYNIDQNTFGLNTASTVAGITETDSQFGGLCLECHVRTNLTPTDSPNSSLAWKSRDRIHRTVKDWGNPINTKHSYSCSKCHSTHNSRLPRLMVTNCLNASHKGRTGLNSAPALSAGGSGFDNWYAECSGNPLFCFDNGSGGSGSGSGRFPGTYTSAGANAPGTFNVSCHENSTGSGTDQSWNNKTPWSDDRPVITSPSAGNFRTVGADLEATISWQTDRPADSCVDFGLTSSYGSTKCSTNLVTGHIIKITLPGGTNHSTYHYRVRSLTASSTDLTFFISTPPQPPVLKATQPFLCTSACSAVVSWNAALDPDSGPVQYQVEIDSAYAFNTANKVTSGWIDSLFWDTPSLATNNTWYFRVRARDSNYTETSSFSSSSSFKLSNRITSGPSAGSFQVLGSGIQAAISWNTEIPTYGLVEYGLTTDYSMTTAFELTSSLIHTIWLPNLVNHSTYHYRVRFKDSFNNEITSGDYSFSVSVPPSTPVLSSPANGSTLYSAGSVTVDLQWNESSDPDAPADQIQYLVEMDIQSTPTSTSPDYRTSGWITGAVGLNSWAAASLPTDSTWYWRVKARHNETESAWSTVYRFNISSVQPPPSPTIIPHGNYDSGCQDTLVTVSWNAVASPDGDPVQYLVYRDGYGDSGWLPVGQTTWSFINGAGAGVTWKVKARDAIHLIAESSYSSSEFFSDAGSGCWSGSCPLVFSWNGTKYEYETDLQGPVIGLPPSNIKKETSLYQPTYIVLNGLEPDNDNQYRLKIRESLSEITFLDEVKLLSIEYPAGYEIATSAAENTYNYGYVNPFRIYTFKDPAAPVAATDRYGNDVLASLLTVDNVPAAVSINPESPDFFTLDFGSIARPDHAKLLIDGWSIYGVKKFQAAATIQPSIEVMDMNGKWVKVKTFGTPAGDLKTMVVDIANVFLSSDHRIRLNMGMRKGSRWVIDRIRLDDSPPVSVAMEEIPPLSGNLQYAGMAIEQMSTLDTRIIAGDVALPVVPEALGYGAFTRYGDVQELLSVRDDKYVIMRHGDNIDVAFPASVQPQAGKSRGFVLKADLYYKTFGVTNVVEPLPFHGMSDYPYTEPEAYPADEEHSRYQTEYNTRMFYKE